MRVLAGLGGLPPGMEGMPPVWNTYIATDDCASVATKVTEAGGSVVMPPMQVVDAGSMAIFADPTGAAFSVWQADQHIGAQVANVPGTFAWHELMTRDIEGAKAFYTEVFGWEYDTQDMANGTYNVITGGENGGRGGLMAMPEDVPDQAPNHWMPYILVADVKATIASIEGAGGQIVNGPFPLPGIGQMAVVHDPSGGTFSLMQPDAA